MVQWIPKAGCCSWQRSSVWRGLDSYGFAATCPKLRHSAADVQLNTPGRWICWSGTYLIEWLHCKPPVRCRGWLAMVWEVTSWISMIFDHFEFKIFKLYGNASPKEKSDYVRHEGVPGWCPWHFDTWVTWSFRAPWADFFGHGVGQFLMGSKATSCPNPRGRADVTRQPELLSHRTSMN